MSKLFCNDAIISNLLFKDLKQILKQLDVN